MPTTTNEQLVDTVNSGNLKMLADMAQGSFGLSIQNAVANQQQVQVIQNAALQGFVGLHQTIVGLLVKRLMDTSAEEAVAFTKQIGSDLQDKITQIGASLAGVQEDVKLAQSTPPQTGGDPLLTTLAQIQAMLQSLIAGSGGKAA